MKVLVTGFTPFMGEKINPSWQVASGLADVIGGNTLIKILLTTAFGTCVTQLTALIEQHQPDAIIMLGQAGGRKNITFEKVAINYAEAKGYDVEGVLQGNEINASGQAAYFSTLPLNEMIQAVTAKGIPCSLSLSAGSFVCNYLMYSALEATSSGNTKVGFIHLPYCEEQIEGKAEGTPFATIKDMITAITAALEVL